MWMGGGGGGSVGMDCYTCLCNMGASFISFFFWRVIKRFDKLPPGGQVLPVLVQYSFPPTHSLSSSSLGAGSAGS